jgi:ribosome-binding protein aMBF1 (putative translation factor)
MLLIGVLFVHPKVTSIIYTKIYIDKKLPIDIHYTGKGGNMNEQEFYQKLGVLIQEARKESGLNQNELADKIGVNRSFVARVESQGEKISAYRLNQILEALTGDNLLKKKQNSTLTLSVTPI